MVAGPSEVAYYYPAPYWSAGHGDWIKSLLLFFDQVAILLPDYMYGVHRSVDPTLAGPLEDLGLLEVLEPTTWISQDVIDRLANTMVELLTDGTFADLDTSVHYHELSQSRMGYGVDVGLADMLVEELQERHLAKPTTDGVSIPLHPVVRTTILVLLAQLARGAGSERGLRIHPTTDNRQAAEDLLQTLRQPVLASAGNVVALDLEAVTLDLSRVPLDDVLAFRAEHRDGHKAYMDSLRGFMVELAETAEPERANLIVDRRQELADTAHDLQRTARRAFARNLATWSLGIAGSAWSYRAHDPLGLALTAGGLAAGLLPGGAAQPSAYSYIFQAAHQL